MGFNYQPLTLGLFTKGMTDYAVGGPTDSVEKAFNFYLSLDNKMRVRPGSSMESTTLTDACNKLSVGLNQILSPLARFSNEQCYRLVVTSGETRIYYRPNDTTTAFTELLGLNSNSLYPTGSTKSSKAQWNKQYYLAPMSIDWYPQRLWDDNGTLKLATAFIPAFSGVPTGSGSQTDDVAVCLKTTHTVGDRTYTIRSAPLFNRVNSAAGVLSNLYIYIYGPTTHNWDYSNITAEIYRTQLNGTQYYLVYEALLSSYGAPSTGGTGWNAYRLYLASTPSIKARADDSTIVNGVSLYTNDGTVPFSGSVSIALASGALSTYQPYSHYPLMPKHIHVTDNGVMYRGNVVEIRNTDTTLTGIPVTSYQEFAYPARVYQSVPGIPESQPDDFFFELDSDNTAITSYQGIPLLFTAENAYRVEGVIDRYGEGTAYTKRIEQASGTSSDLSVVVTPMGVFWAGQYGFYWSNGYEAYKISEKINETYRTQIGQNNANIEGVYDAANQLILWTDGSAKMYVLHLRFGISPYMVFTTWGGYETEADITQTLEMSHAVSEFGDPIDTNFYATGLAIRNGIVHRADSRGYVFQFDEAKGSDPRVVTSENVSAWSTMPYLWDLRTTHLDFGSRLLQKWTPQITLGVTGIATASDPQTLAILLQTERNVSGTPQLLKEFKSSVADGALFKQNRKMPSPGLRCELRQIYIQTPFTVIASSETYTLATVYNDGVNPKQVLVDHVTIWPDDAPVGKYMSFDYDNYTTQHLVTAWDEINYLLTFGSAGSDFPPAGTGYKWTFFDATDTEYSYSSDTFSNVLETNQGSSWVQLSNDVTADSSLIGSYISFESMDFSTLCDIQSASGDTWTLQEMSDPGDYMPPDGGNGEGWVARKFLKDSRFQLEDLTITWAPMSDGRQDFRGTQTGNNV
jgi:hypothetical protein